MSKILNPILASLFIECLCNRFTPQILPVLITYSTKKSDVVFKYTVICATWAFLNNLTTLLSMFLVAVLSVSRSLTLLKPSYLISHRTVRFLSLGYAALLVGGICSVPLWHRHMKYSFNRHYGYCSMEVDRAVDMDLYFKLISLFLFVPVIPVCGSCVLSSYQLRKSVVVTQHNHVITSLKLHATLTILIVTVIYIIFNMPLFIYLSLNYHNETLLAQVLSRSQRSLLRVLLDIVCVGLNAAINPLVYFGTMNNYRTALRELTFFNF